MKQNITLALEKDLLSELKVLAARKSMSISGMLSSQLREIVEQEKQYEQCKNRALASLRQGYHFGGRPASREELHAR
ncbi:hypothetical protein [Desulfonatronum sp. SC1]|uniref:hypothetical protein n=1 Tax=Desulfonatronum sp. SC1 TaxID=2109626 RepID=UPI000D2FB3D0|nr:hypothetical protein [Desulfonatronum sp. SC1]PTN37188.1 hypothetical protein C6366_07300 [Desulfonatronum sp. SC1]